MTVRIGINGFGRMGRLAARALWGDEAVALAHINDPGADAGTLAHLLEFDSVHRRWDRAVAARDGAIAIDGTEVTVGHAAEPGAIDWAGRGVDLVLECSGRFKTPAKLAPHFEAGARSVLVSAPVKEAGALNLVYGINDHLYDPAEHRIVTAASCTTNCLAPVVKVVHEAFGIRHGAITTVHDVTNTQVMVDAPHKDLRRARSALTSLVPTTTGSATAIGLIYPDLAGKLDGHAVRVPLLNASLTDCVFELETATDAESVNALFRAAAAGSLAGILGVEDRPLVSCDFTDDPRSAIVDAPSTLVVDGTQLKVYAWYDNEWGYACRMADLARMIARRIG